MKGERRNSPAVRSSPELGRIDGAWRRRLGGAASEDADGPWFAGVPEFAGEVEELLALLMTGGHQAGEDAVDEGTGQRLVAAADLAADDGGPEHAFGVVVGRGHGGLMQEDEPLAAMLAEASEA